MQLSMFDMLRQPPIARPVDPFGPVIKGAAQETLILPHPRLAWDLAEIELHPHDGLWMWSASSACGSSYKVGIKWGKFAASRDDAAHYAATEILQKAARLRASRLCIESASISQSHLRQIEAWAQAIADDPSAHRGKPAGQIRSAA